MMQKVDLLPTLSPHPEGYLRAKNLLIYLALWCLLLIFVYAISWKLIERKQVALDKLRTDKQNVEQQVNKGLAQHAASQHISDSRASAIKFLTTKNSIGFSYYLEGLAKTIPPGIWLQIIRFSNTDNSIALIGNSTSAAYIPEFLHNMKSVKAFLGKNFNVLSITKIEHGKNENYIAFELAANGKHTS
jgi:Tfp pilus assembly protein PilN